LGNYQNFHENHQKGTPICGKSPFFNGKIHYKWPFSIAFCMFTIGGTPIWKPPSFIASGCVPSASSLEASDLKRWWAAHPSTYFATGREEDVARNAWDFFSGMMIIDNN